ncbi:uncharacterized protein RCO7_04902 [Rhynchosporium graminicola]|uniref:Uncharacterized protein n=1 Tax=Rhynchosporium graminicola TaxID=2792576 RepID=A0A1E1KI21_9HELO|nr:uncharacterized protein RCO7_04902 [Rhynchosporium commune]
MPLKSSTQIESELAAPSHTQQTLYTLRHKRSSILHRIRSRSTPDYLKHSSPTPTIPEKVPEVPSVREGPLLRSSTSAMFIAKMKSELFLSQFKRAQEAYLLGDLSLCQHRCDELLNIPALHLDTRIETLQLLSMVVPLHIAQDHLSDALCLLDLAAERGGIGPAQTQALLGLRITTIDLLARVETEMGRARKEDEAPEWRMQKSSARKRISYQPLIMQVAQSMPLHQI